MDNTIDLFEKIIREWYRRFPNESKTLNQIANMALGAGNSRNASQIGKIIHEFNEYFIRESMRKTRVNWERVQSDHPHLTAPRPHRAERSVSNTCPTDEMVQAINDEIKEVRREMERRPVKALWAARLEIPNETSLLYESGIELPGDTELPIPEGVGILLRWRGIGQMDVEATLLSYDPLRTNIIFKVEKPLPRNLENKEFFVLPRVDELLKAVRAKVVKLKSQREAIAWRLLSNKKTVNPKTWTGSVQKYGLDDTQAQAVERCLKQDITFMWGPPGTGKTHTLARLIATVALNGKRVIATAIANVAVDQLALQIVRALEESGEAGRGLLNQGQVLRFGYSRLPEVSGESRLFPDKAEAQKLRKELDAAKKRHQQIPSHDSVARARSQDRINEIGKALRDVTKKYILQSRIVLTTAVQTCIETAFNEAQFELVIVDEASMMPIPYAVCVSMLTTERVVVAGDFRQLGPIATSQTHAAHQWLHRDPFQLVGIPGNLSHPGLVMLSIQRRMHERICDLINMPFYEGRLQSKASQEKTKACAIKPLPGQPAILVSLLPEDGSEVQRTEGGSRKNVKSAETVVKLVDRHILSNDQIKIGIITPYRAQVSLIKRMLKEKEIPEPALKRVTVGTVHAFQGSEADVVIWDLVETRDHPIGKLYQGNTGERLGNVAISRAQGKLIVIGDPDAFYKAPSSNLVGKIRGIFTNHFAPRLGNIVMASELTDSETPKKSRETKQFKVRPQR